MSEWSTRRDAIENVFTTASGIRIKTVRPGLQPGDKFDDREYPVLMVGAFVENAVDLTWQQQEITTSVVALYWKLASQAKISADADVLRDAINVASGTGTVVGRELAEFSDRDLRVVRFEIEDKVVT